MSRNGFDAVCPMGENFPIYYRKCAQIAQFYQPDVMLRKGYARISGSIGFCIISSDLNDGLAINEALNPKNGCMASLRIENFKDISNNNSIDTEDYSTIKLIIDKIISSIDEEIPSTLAQAIEKFWSKSSWVYLLLGQENNGFDDSVHKIVYQALVHNQN